MRIERLGRAWGALDQRIAQHRQFLAQTPPNTPNYQQTVQEGLAAISSESSRIIGELNSLLTPPDERAQFANFLTAELGETLNLNSSQKTTLFSYFNERLDESPTLDDGMKALALTTQTKTAVIKAMLTPEQRQLFDRIYGAGGVLLFSYAKAVALGEIGP